jgi:peptidoglycan/xylan/chitin deacetylase (PgdA/CDA1 family)
MHLRQFALDAYYFGTLPYRAGHMHRLKSRGRAPLCVLFYHRVADRHPNPWSIGFDRFARQIRWLKANVDLVSLAEIQERMRQGCNDRVAVHVTFDDGYSENCDRAIPFLLEHEVPTTYFVALDFAVRQQPFPHDVEAGVPLRPNSIAQLREMARAGIEIGAHTRTHCDVGAIGDPATLRDELVTATAELAERVQQPIRYFAFPYGQPSNVTAAAAELLRASGIRGVCSAYGGYNLPGEDAFHVQRIHGDPEWSRFRNWMTVDPRKVGVGRRVEFPAPVTPEKLTAVRPLPALPPPAPTAAPQDPLQT